MRKKPPRGRDGHGRDQIVPKVDVIRQKREDTLIQALRDACGLDFAPGLRAGATLQMLRNRTDRSLRERVHDARK